MKRCQGKFEKLCQPVPALSVAARHLSQRERQVWIVRKSKKIRTGFSALPLGELAFAEQMTERAAHWQIRVRANLKNHVSWFQPSLSLRDISPKGRDKFGLRGKPKPSSLRKVSRRKP